ncbi:MAG: tRNA pseudouridine(55) synthase TruB [Chthonomonas sp.]|nr:tRNA pseudouridine(55) synthase TruB [Chthonomonas sp.]
MLGILNIDKPQGITSHDVVNRVRRSLGTRRVGHAGTLDPLATGALVVAVGPATRFLQYLPLEPKVYEFTVQFGVETNSQDSEGEVVAEKPVPSDLQTQILDRMPHFAGEVLQIPPMFSAVKREGKPLYQLARQGVEVERESRTVYIEEFTLVKVEGATGKFRCACSGGTYVRTLAHDLGQMIGCGGHVTELRRTAVGRFRVEDAIALEDVSLDHLMPLAEALSPMPMIPLSGELAGDVWNGKRVGVRPVPEEKYVALQDPKGRVISVAEVVVGGFLQPTCVIPQEALNGEL